MTHASLVKCKQAGFIPM